MVKWLHRYLKKVIDDSTTSEDTVKLLKVSDKSVVENGKNNQFSNCVRRQENATPNLGYFVALGPTTVSCFAFHPQYLLISEH